MSVTSATLNAACFACGAAATSDVRRPAGNRQRQTATSAAATSGMNMRAFTYPP